MATVTLNIDGMTCGGCANSVTRVLNELNGVTRASVNLAEKNAVVEYDDAQIQPEELIEAVEDAGYDASAA